MRIENLTKTTFYNKDNNRDTDIADLFYIPNDCKLIELDDVAYSIYEEKYNLDKTIPIYYFQYAGRYFRRR